MRALPLFLLVATGLAHAAPIDALQPMSYLAGHCWKGNIPASTSTDEHCFEWILDGRAMRNTHVVRTDGKVSYQGETTYYWSPISKAIEYLYLESSGGVSRGNMETVANTLVLPPAQQAQGEAAGTYRMRWAPVGNNAYDSWAEKLGPDGTWHTMFKMTMTRTRSLGAAPRSEPRKKSK